MQNSSDVLSSMICLYKGDVAAEGTGMKIKTRCFSCDQRKYTKEQCSNLLSAIGLLRFKF